jgi:hypothetical protein
MSSSARSLRTHLEVEWCVRQVDREEEVRVMRQIRRVLRFGGVVVAAALFSFGCSGGDFEKMTRGSQAVCEANCDRAAALACSRTPADWTSNCKGRCEAARSAYPECAHEIDAVSACVADKVTFICQDGITTVSPIGACRVEVPACLACTGDAFACVD